MYALPFDKHVVQDLFAIAQDARKFSLVQIVSVALANHTVRLHDEVPNHPDLQQHLLGNTT